MFFQSEIRKSGPGFLLVFLFITLLTGCKNTETNRLEVYATAYNTVPWQTNKDHPTIGAWGDTLKPGIKSIAVSRDLIDLGITRHTEIEIEGFPGTYLVLDKMNKRWSNKIDIYMEMDEDSAREWGIQKVTIMWEVEK